MQYATIIQIVTPSSFCRADLGAQPAPLRYTRQNKLRLRTFSTPLIYCLHAMPQLRAPSASSCLCRTNLQHLDDFEELIGQLPGPSFAELVGKAAIVPKRFFARLTETGPETFADIRFSQIAKYCAGIVDLVRERDAQYVVIGGVEMREIGVLSLLPVRFSLAFGCVGKAVRARRHHARHTIAEPVSDILQPRLPP